MNITFLSQLRLSGFNYTIHVRISRMWEYRGTSDDDPVKHLDLVIVDEKHNAMYVDIPPDAIPDLRPFLDEGRIVTIKKFLVENAKPLFKVVDSPYMLRFYRRTVINPQHAEPPSFPRYVYTLTPIAELAEHTNKKDRFLDVIGYITAISNAARVRTANGKQQMKRIVILSDESGNKVELSLSGSRAVEFDGEAVYESGKHQPIISIFVGTLYKALTGPQFLSGTSACRWYINEDIPHINDFYICLPSDTKPVEKLLLTNDTNFPTQFTRKTDETFECTVTITKLSPNQSWMYPACRACRSTFNIFGSAYKCTKEKCLSTEFNYRYKLCLMGADESGCELEFVLFDKIAQHLIGKPVDRLQKLYSMDDTPKEVSGLVGQKYTFIVKISVKKSIKSLDPSFEVVYVSQQHGRQTNIPIIPKVENIDTSISSSAYLAELPITSIAKAPLKPIKSKGNIELGSIIPPLQPPSEGDPMDIEQNVNISQENMYATKRPYTDKTQEGYDEDEDTKNVRQHKRSRQ